MNTRHLSHFVWALAACAAYFAGYSASTPSTAARSSAASSQPPGSATATEPDSARTLSQSPGDLKRATLNADQIKAETFRCLAVGDRFERTRLICELVPSITKENWRTVADALARQTETEFRLPTPEWGLIVERLGQVAGAEALDEWLANPAKAHEPRIRTALTGWAASNPKDALAWFEAQDPARQQNLLKTFVDGLSRADTRQALDLMVRYPNEVQDQLAPNILDNAMQRDGLRATEQSFSSLLANPDGVKGVAGKVFIMLARRRMYVDQMLGRPNNALEWFDGYLGPNTPAGPNATLELINSAAGKDPIGTAKWLDERDHRLAPHQQETAYPAVARSLLQSSPDQFVAWIEKHTEHPQYDAMVQVTASRLYQGGKTEEASRLVAAMKNPETRDKLQNGFSTLKVIPKPGTPRTPPGSQGE